MDFILAENQSSLVCNTLRLHIYTPRIGPKVIIDYGDKRGREAAEADQISA